MILEPNAVIEGERYEDAFGKPHVAYRWVKLEGEGNVASISPVGAAFYELFSERIPPKKGQVVTLGQLRLRVVELQGRPPFSVLVMLDGYETRLWSTVYPFIKWVQSIKYKLIWTCIIWGLAENSPPGEYPTWDNVYLIRKVKQWLKKLS